MAFSLTFLLVLAFWPFFRATTMGGALAMLDAMAGCGGGYGSFTPSPTLRFADLPWAFTPAVFPVIAAAAVAIGVLWTLVLPNTTRIFRYREYRHAPDRSRSVLQWRPNAVWAFIMASAFAACIFGMRQRVVFLYFQF